MAWLFFVEPSKDVVGASTVQFPPKTWMARISNMSESAVRLPFHFWAIAHGYMIYANSMTKNQETAVYQISRSYKTSNLHPPYCTLPMYLIYHTTRSYHQLRTQRWGSRYSPCQRGERPQNPRPKMEDEDDITALINPASVVNTQAAGWVGWVQLRLPRRGGDQFMNLLFYRSMFRFSVILGVIWGVGLFGTDFVQWCWRSTPTHPW